MQAAIVTIGDEILYGQIVDTNAQYIADLLTEIGIKVRYKVSIGDTSESIQEALLTYTEKVDLMLCTGGLGPTKDDLTKAEIARFLNDTLICHQPTLTQIKSFFEKRNRPLLDSNIQQAYVPSSCEVLINTVGTAPGMWFNLPNGHILISLPGVPYEMKHLMQEHVLPKLKNTYKLPVIYHKMIYTAGMGESFIAEKIKAWEEALPDYIKLAYLPSLGMVKLRLTAIGQDMMTVEKALTESTNTLLSILGDIVYAVDTPATLEQAIFELCVQHGITLSTAESCTGGELARCFTQLPGISSIFMGGIVAYSNEIKIKQLLVADDILLTHGAVSEEVAAQMALGACKVMGSALSISTTGIAGPGGTTQTKPVGTVCIGISNGSETMTKTMQFQGSRANIIRLSTVASLYFLWKNFHTLISDMKKR